MSDIPDWIRNLELDETPEEDDDGPLTKAEAAEQAPEPPPYVLADEAVSPAEEARPVEPKRRRAQRSRGARAGLRAWQRFVLLLLLLLDVIVIGALFLVALGRFVIP